MTRAIPGAFGRIPPHHATEVRADRRSLMESAIVIPIHSNFGQPAPEDGAFTAADLRDVVYVSRRDEIGVLRGHVYVFLEELRRRAESFARWIVQSGPGILTPHDQVGEEHPGDGAVRHAVAGISGGDINIVA